MTGIGDKQQPALSIFVNQHRNILVFVTLCRLRDEQPEIVCLSLFLFPNVKIFNVISSTKVSKFQM